MNPTVPLTEDELKVRFKIAVNFYNVIVCKADLHPDKTFSDVALEVAQSADLPTFCTPQELLGFFSGYQAQTAGSIKALLELDKVWAKYLKISTAQEEYRKL